MMGEAISDFKIMIIIILLLMFLASFFLMKFVMKKLKDYDDIKDDDN